MNDTTKMALAAAVAGGYVLGRTRKAKFALGLATYLVGRRFGVSPQQLVTEGLRSLAESPQLGQLGDQIRGELRDAGRARLDSIADALHERTQLLSSPPQDEEEEEEPEAAHEEDEEEPEDEERGERERRRAPRAPSRPQAAKKAAPAKKTAGKAAKKTTKKAAAKKTAAKKTAARKTSAARPGRGR